MIRHPAPTKAPRHLPERKPAPAPTVEAVTPEHYAAARKKRIEALASIPGAGIDGNGLGYYMEVQEARLRQLTAGTAVKATLEGSRILIGPLTGAFTRGSVQLEDGNQSMLAIVVPVFTEYEKTLITIHCYTDSSGPADFNRKLSTQRGLAVARYLVKSGVNPGRLIVVGHGDADPIASNATAKGRARNRRVEIELDPITAPAPASAPAPRAPDNAL